MVLPSHALVLLVHGGLWPGGVGWWAVVVVVVVVVVVALRALVAVVLVVVVMVLRVCSQDPLAFRWGLGVGHRLQPLGLYSLVGSGSGWGAGLDGDRCRGVPRPRVGLAGGGGGLRGVDDGALGDGDVDEGLDGVKLRLPLWMWLSLRGGGLGMRWVLGPGLRLGDVLRQACVASAAVVPFVIFEAVWDGVGDVVGGDGGGGAAAGGVVVWVPVLVCGLVLGWGPVQG